MHLLPAKEFGSVSRILEFGYQQRRSLPWATRSVQCCAALLYLGSFFGTHWTRIGKEFLGISNHTE
jgi:hypothetical protein